MTKTVLPISDSAHVKLLCELGITPIQAKVYLTLYSLGSSSARSLVEILGTHRADVYRAIQRLQELGIIETTIGNPNKYSPIDPAEVVDLLTQRLDKNMTLLKNKSIRLVRTLKSQNSKQEEPEIRQTEQFFKLKSGETVIKSIISLVDEAESEIREVASTDALRYHLAYGLADTERDAIRRGVKIRLVTDHYTDAFRNYLNMVDTRFFGDLGESLKFIIIDDKLVQMALAASAKFKSEALALNTNNKTLVRTLSAHFTELWKNASTRT